MTKIENQTRLDEKDSNDLQDAIAKKTVFKTQSQTETLIKEVTIFCKGRANGLR